MPWTIDGTRIFVNESEEDAGNILPRLQPLSGSTVIQVFGWESDIRNIKGLIVGDTDRDALKDLRKTGSSYTLESPEGTVGSFQVKKVHISRIHSICQTIRPDLAENAPVYQFEIELYD